MMKIFYLILAENSKDQNDVNKMNTSWVFIKSYMKSNNIKKELDQLIHKEISKELIDQAMPFNLNYNEIKNSLTKINKNLILFLDLIKFLVDFNIKNNIVKSLYQSNLNKNAKMQLIKQEMAKKDLLIKEAREYSPIMQNELTTLLTQKKIQLYECLINKYDFLEKYKIFYSDKIESFSGNQNTTAKSKITIKLKGKYKSREDFVMTILSSKEKNINLSQTSQILNDSNQEIENKINLISSIPKLKLPKMTKSAIENISNRSRNIQNNLYSPNVNVSSENPFSNVPSKVYYTSERDRNRDNDINLSVSNRHKSISSTVKKDLETLEQIIHSDKKVDVIPQSLAQKPTPKSQGLSREGNLNRKKTNSMMIGPDNMFKKLNYNTISNDFDNKNSTQGNNQNKINTTFQEIKKESQTKKDIDVLRIESNKTDFFSKFCYC